jgi:hypothetical protein
MEAGERSHTMQTPALTFEPQWVGRQRRHTATHLCTTMSPACLKRRMYCTAPTISVSVRGAGLRQLRMRAHFREAVHSGHSLPSLCRMTH